MSATGGLTNRPGHDLHLEVDQRHRFSQCSPAGGSVISLPANQPLGRQRHADRFPLGSQSAWRMAMYLPGRLQNSHRNGGRVGLIFVADPRTAQLFRNFARDDDPDTGRGRSVAFLGMLMPT
jgi:hypothetical protein